MSATPVQKFVTHLQKVLSLSQYCTHAFQSHSVVLRYTACGSRVLRWSARISEPQCHMMLVIAIVGSLGLVHAVWSSQDTGCIFGSCVAHSPSPFTHRSHGLSNSRDTTGIVMDLVCPLKQLLCARHAVARSIVPTGVTRALSKDSDGKSERIQSQL